MALAGRLVRARAPAARELHLPAVVIDMKADPGLAATLAAIATQTGRQFHHVTADATGTSYNPLAGLTADEMSDALYYCNRRAESASTSPTPAWPASEAARGRSAWTT